MLPLLTVRFVKNIFIGNQIFHISVDRRNAGNGELQVEITDPTGSPLRTEMLKSPGGEDRITFLPNQTGPHKINVKVAGFQIPGKCSV